jgi:hypothetical protein
MNIVQVQDQLKNFSQDQLVREMQSPTGNAPQYLVLSEIMRRQRMQQDFAAQQGKNDQGTVAQEAIAAAGVPQGGLASMASAMAPQTDMAESTGVQAMAAGGPVKKMAKGGAAMTDPAIRAMANRLGMSVEEYLRSVGDEQAAQLEQSAGGRALRERMVGMEPQQASGIGGVNPSYVEDLTGRFPVSGFSEPAPQVQPMTYGRPLSETLAAKTGTLLPPTQDVYSQKLSQTADTMDQLRAERAPRPAPSGRQLAYEQARASGTADPLAAMVDPVMTGLSDFGGAVTGRTVEEQKAIDAQRAAAAVGEGPAFERKGRGAPTLDELLADSAAEEAAAQETEAAAAGGVGGAGGAGSGGGGGGIAGAGGMSSYEQELMNALGRREKAAQQDKWLALAQVGLNMMSSTNPTLLGAVGEAGLKGVEAARAARDQYDKDRLDLMGAIEQSRLSRAAAAAKGSGGGGSAGIAGLKLKDYLSAVNSDIERLDTLISDASSGLAATTPEGEMQLAEMQNERGQLVALRQSLLYGAPISADGGDNNVDAADE